MIEVNGILVDFTDSVDLKNKIEKREGTVLNAYEKLRYETDTDKIKQIEKWILHEEGFNSGCWFIYHELGLSSLL